MKYEIELNDWEIGTIIDHLYNHRKNDKQSIIDGFENKKIDVPMSLIATLNDLEQRYTDLMNKFIELSDKERIEKYGGVDIHFLFKK